MSRRKNTKKNQYEDKKEKEYVVIKRNAEEYVPFDLRANKPICYKDNPLSGGKASMVIQVVENFEFQTRIDGIKNSINYYAPNNVGILLSIANKSLIQAKDIYRGNINPDTVNHLENYGDMSRTESIIKKSRVMYDFIETVQVSIVFGYTALEAFANLSIPENYEYKANVNSKGIIEIYDKNAIERWVTLRIKISEILVNVYKTDDILKKTIWNQFLEFEKLRNDIIHQKSIADTKLYHRYLKKDFFKLCDVPEKIIAFFYDELGARDKTNALWPWVINTKGGLPVSYEYMPEDFEVIGNIYEGRKK